MAIQLSAKQQNNALIKQTAHKQNSKAKVVNFVAKEVNMMPAQWKRQGNPTPYELSTTIATCKRLWHMNKEALNHPECNIKKTQENIKTLERLYLMLMDYLVA